MNNAVVYGLKCHGLKINQSVVNKLKPKRGGDLKLFHLQNRPIMNANENLNAKPASSSTQLACLINIVLLVTANIAIPQNSQSEVFGNST